MQVTVLDGATFQSESIPELATPRADVGGVLLYAPLGSTPTLPPQAKSTVQCQLKITLTKYIHIKDVRAHAQA